MVTEPAATDLLPTGDALDEITEPSIEDAAEDIEEAVEEAVEVDEEVVELVDPPDDPTRRPGQWYVVHTQSGYEKKVTANLNARIQSMNMEDKIFEVVIPMEEVDEVKNGKKQTVQRKVFPGYLLVRCKMDDDTWYCVRNTPGITGFVGQSRHGQKPTPLSRDLSAAGSLLKKPGASVLDEPLRSDSTWRFGADVPPCAGGDDSKVPVALHAAFSVFAHL